MKYALAVWNLSRRWRAVRGDLGRSDRRLVLRVLPVNPQAYALLGFTALVAVLVSVVAWALLRFVSAARDTRHRLRDAGESPLLAIALQEGIQKLRAQERAMTERAEASEALSTQIVNSLTAGLLVVDRQGQVQILNPAGRKMLGITDGRRRVAYQRAATRRGPARWRRQRMSDDRAPDRATCTRGAAGERRHSCGRHRLEARPKRSEYRRASSVCSRTSPPWSSSKSNSG